MRYIELMDEFQSEHRTLSDQEVRDIVEGFNGLQTTKFPEDFYNWFCRHGRQQRKSNKETS